MNVKQHTPASRLPQAIAAGCLALFASGSIHAVPVDTPLMSKGDAYEKRLETKEALNVYLELEKQHIERVLQEEHGRVEKAAKRLGIPRSSLYQKLKKHQISSSKV